MNTTLNSAGAAIGQVAVSDFPNNPAIIVWGKRIFSADAFGTSYSERSALFIEDSAVSSPPPPDAGVAYTVGDLQRLLAGSSDDRRLDIWVNGTGHVLAAVPGLPANFWVYESVQSIPSTQKRVALVGELRRQVSGDPDAAPVLVWNGIVKSLMVMQPEMATELGFDIVPVPT